MNEFVIKNGYIAQNDSVVSGSLTVTNGITGGITGTASYASQADSASYATSASTAVSASQANSSSYTLQALSASVADIAISSSYAATASYAMNAGGGGVSAIYIADQGTLQGTASYFDFNGSGVSTTVTNNTASIVITGGGGSGVAGLTTTFTQSVADSTWTFTHNLNTRSPLVQVYDTSYNQITPQSITSTNASTVVISFGVPVSGYAVASMGGTLIITGSNVILNQPIAATTWSFNHGLNTQYPIFQVFNSDDEVVLPQLIKAVDSSSALIYFPTPVAGKAVASFAGISGSFGGGTGAGFPYSGSAVITGSLEVSGSGITGSLSGSLIGTASYATQALSSSFATYAISASNAPGFTVQYAQTIPASTWSFTHNLNTRNPIVQVYDSTYKQIIPNDIVATSGLTAEIRFDYSESGYVVFSNGGGLYITGSTSQLNQDIAAVTWSFTHNLNSKYVNFEVYDSNDLVIIPAGIRAMNSNQAELYFSTAQTGIAVANFSGISGSTNAVTASYALTATSSSYATVATTATTASFANAFTVAGTLTAQTLVVQTITSSVDFVTGSTRFGTIIGNTHQFTGSVGISGSTTLTGALSGTSATFSGNVLMGTATSNGARLEIKQANSLDYRGLLVVDSATPNWIGMAHTGTAGVISAWYDGAGTATPLIFKTGDTTRLTIASTGAATFSSSVNVQNFLTVSAASTLLAPSSGKSIEMVYRTDGANDYAFIQAYDRTASVFKRLDLNSAITILGSGNVGIGTSSPNTIASQTSTLSLGGTNPTISGGISYQVNGSVKMYQYIDSDGLFIHQALSGVGQKFFTDNTERMRIGSTASQWDLMVGCTSVLHPAANRGSISVNGTSNSIYSLGVGGSAKGYLYHGGTQMYLENSVGSITVIAGGSNGVLLSSGATSWTSASDERLKNINSEIENALEKIMTLRAVNFSWKSDETNKENLGFIAQEVEKVFPQVIDKNKLFKGVNDDNEDKTEYLGVRYQELTPVNTKAIQELYQLVLLQDAKIEELKALIAAK